MPTPAPVPPAIGPGDRVIQHTLMGRYHLQVWVNTHYGLISVASPSSTELLDCAAKFWTGVGAAYRAATVVQLAFDKIITRVVGHPEVPSTSYIIAGALTGQVEQDGLPGTVAAVITRRSAFGGKRGRGRVYLPGIGEENVTNGAMNGAQVTLCDTLAATFILDWGQGDFGHQYAFHWSKPIPPDTSVRGAMLISAKTDPILGNQRRRRPGRGI